MRTGIGACEGESLPFSSVCILLFMCGVFERARGRVCVYVFDYVCRRRLTELM